MEKKPGLPSFWASKLAKLLVGDGSCALSVWLPAHFSIAKRQNDFDSVGWKAKHTELLNATIEKLKEQGWTCKVESQNYFKLKGNTAELAGKPDIVARKGAALKVLDCKTGQPQDAHAGQVALYCIALPMVWHQPNLHIDGEVVYTTHSVPVPWEKAYDLQAKLFALMRRLGTEERPPAVSSESECRFCDVSKADCPERWEPSDAEKNAEFISTSEW